MYARSKIFRGEHRPAIRRTVAGLVITGYLVAGQAVAAYALVNPPKKYHVPFLFH